MKKVLLAILFVVLIASSYAVYQHLSPRGSSVRTEVSKTASVPPSEIIPRIDEDSAVAINDASSAEKPRLDEEAHAFKVSDIKKSPPEADTPESAAHASVPETSNNADISASPGPGVKTGKFITPSEAAGIKKEDINLPVAAATPVEKPGPLRTEPVTADEQAKQEDAVTGHGIQTAGHELKAPAGTKPDKTGSPETPDQIQRAEQTTPPVAGGLPGSVIPEDIPSPSQLSNKNISEIGGPTEIKRPEALKHGPAGKRIAILPFENLSGFPEAEQIVRPAIMHKIKSMGYEVVDPGLLSDILCSEEVRNMSRISTGTSRTAGEKLFFNSVLAGAVVSYITEKRPEIGLIARITDTSTGRVLWADHASVTGNDHITLLGLGRIDSMERLFPEVADKLFSSFNQGMISSPRTALPRIAVLPFKNSSESPYASDIASHLFTVNLFKSGLYEPIDPGDVRRMLVDLRIRQRGELSYSDLSAFSATFGTNYIIVGTVEQYKKPKAAIPPKVSISARLLDTRRNRILWYNNLFLTGEDRIIAFDWGRLRTADMVADALAHDFIKKMGKDIVTTRVADSYFLEISRKD